MRCASLHVSGSAVRRGGGRQAEAGGDGARVLINVIINTFHKLGIGRD